MRSILPPSIVARACGLLAIFLFLSHVAWGQGAYYAPIDTGAATFVTDLRNLINPHLKLSYSITAVADIAARDTTGGQKYVDCVYSGHRQVYTPPWSWGTFSREHTWCHSWMPTHPSESGPEYSDLHHLFPTHQNNANNRRSNHPLGLVVNISYQYLDGKLGTNASGQTVYEPRDEQKGDAARALFYMATAYHGINGKDWSFGYLNSVTLPGLSEAPQSVELLRQWHTQDPPDAWERARNDSVHARQQNRNPFVDHPEYVNIIDFVTMTKAWGSPPDTGSGGGGGGSTPSGSLPQGMAVVVNEYLNAGTQAEEWVELIVLQDQVDLRGLRVRDHSTSGTAQNPIIFSNASAWQSVSHGTIIVIHAVGSTAAEDSSFGDKVVQLRMSNTAFFQSGSNSFNIAGSLDAVQVLTASGQHVHALGHGGAIASIPAPKAQVPGSSTGGEVVRFVDVSDTLDFKDSNKAEHSTTATIAAANDASEDAFLSGLLPVQMQSFTVVATSSGAVTLSWNTATEIDNAGFDVERREIAEPGTPRLSSVVGTWKRIGSVAGAGTSTSVRAYAFTDAPPPGRHAYRLRQVDRHGGSSYSNEVEVEVRAVATSLDLGPAYPNPFNPSTALTFSVARNGHAALKIFDLLGREVASVFDGQAESGRLYRLEWNAGALPSGVYVARLESGGRAVSQRLVLMK